MGKNLSLSIRVTEEMRAKIDESGKQVSDYFITNVNLCDDLIANALRDVADIFSPEEWSFLADSLNGTAVDGAFRFSSGALIANSEDSEKFDGTATRWNVSIPIFADKLRSLTRLQVFAIYTRVEKFWSSNSDLTEWSKY